MMAQFRAVIFDLGGVLVPSPMEYWTKELEPSLGLPRGSVSACLLSDSVLPLFHQLEQGQLSLEDFEPLFTHFYNRQNGTKQQQQQQQPRIRLFSGHRDWARPHSGWEPFLQRLRAAGFRTALCTNNFFVDRASCEDTLPSNLDRTLFDVVVESCRLGIRKPDTAIFKQTLAKLGVSAEEAIFIDDLGSNLKAARAMGIHTVKCSDPSQCQVELQRLLGLDVMPEAPPGTREPTEAERLPLQPLLQYFHAKFGLESAKSDNNNQNQMMHVRKFANGQSNPSYHIRLLGDGREFVLRKKPPGKLLPSAHRIEREFRVQCALKGRVPVPEMLDFVEGVLPTPFYLMRFCRGRIFQDPNLPELKEQQRTEVWLRAAQVLAQIHSVEPARMGLADFGKRGHYFRRNLLRMEAELGQAKERNELARRVLAWLLENCPPAEEEGGGDGIVHGDFRLDNLIWFHDRLEVEAVLDWELSTLGDPLSDLANFLLPFHLPPRWDGQMLMRGVRPAANGIPRPEQLIQAYLQARADLGQPEPRANQLLAHQSALLRFGLVYVLFRNAVILHGVHARFRRGQASNAAAARQLADVPEQLLALAWAQIGQSAQPMGQQQIATSFPLSPEMMRPAAFALYCQVRDFIAEHVMAKELQIVEWARDERTRWTVSPLIEELKNLARQAGLWNLFITEHLDPEARFGGRGLSTAEYGHICELMGRCLWAPEVFNCSAPDTGNMEVLIKYGSEQQRRQFLEPLLQGKVRSCFAMTEPDVASSDATNIQGSIVRDGEGHFLLNSRKWFTSGAADPRCRLCLFMGRILPVPAAEATPLHRRQSILLVPMPAPGLSVVRTLSVLDNLDPPGGHCELLFENVRVPVANMVLGEGRGFEIAQGRLGPGRIHHCMRLLGHAERALELMRVRARCRLVGGGPGGGKQPLTQKQSVRLQLAESRLALEQARLLVLKAAHFIDSRGPKAAAAEIAMIKVATPRTVLTILDRGIQLFGAAGLSQDWPLAQFFVWARALRLADGPDVVHLETVAKRELAKL